MIYRMPMPMVLFLIHCRSKVVLTVAMVHHVICNNRKKTLSTRRYSARLTRHKPKIRDTKDHARLISGAG